MSGKDVCIPTKDASDSLGQCIFNGVHLPDYVESKLIIQKLSDVHNIPKPLMRTDVFIYPRV